MGRFTDLADAYERGQEPPRKVPGDPPPKLVDVAPSGSDMLQAIRSLVECWLSGRPDPETGATVEPNPVELRSLPDDALASERAVARLAAIVQGLWLHDSQRRPMILARTEVARWLADPRMAAVCGLDRPIGQRQVGNCLESLVNWGVLEIVGSAWITGRPRPAHLYVLGAVDRRDEVTRLDREQPSAEAVHDVLVSGTELGGPQRPLDATVNLAADGGRHGTILHDREDAATEGGSAANHYSEEVWR